MTAFLPVARKEGTDAFVMIYGNASKILKSLKGARLTVGGYRLMARNRDFGSRKGWNFGYEQPLAEKVSFSAQWTTGDNRFGYFTPGASIRLTEKSSLFLGYSAGNLYKNFYLFLETHFSGLETFSNQRNKSNADQFQSVPARLQFRTSFYQPEIIFKKKCKVLRFFAIQHKESDFL